MSAFYDNFDTAVDAWRQNGGALLYDAPANKYAAAWSIFGPEELREMHIDPRLATERALMEGGLTDAQIADEMAEWQD